MTDKHRAHEQPSPQFTRNSLLLSSIKSCETLPVCDFITLQNKFFSQQELGKHESLSHHILQKIYNAFG